MKKITPLILLLCLAFILSACSAFESVQGFGKAEPPDEPVNSQTASQDVGSTLFDKAYNTQDPSTVIMTINGSDVTWGEYFYWCSYIIKYLENAAGPIEDYNAPSPTDPESNIADYIMEGARDMAIRHHALYTGAAEAGVKLSEESKKALEDILKSDIANLVGEDGTEEDLYEYLAGIYVTPEVYNFINEVSCLYKDAFEYLYGANGSKMSDEDVLAFAEDNEYITAKHILISKRGEDGKELDEEAQAEAKALAEDIHAQLAEAVEKAEAAGDDENTGNNDSAEDTESAGHEAVVKLFDELMAEYNSDTAESNYPNGYCFTEGKMTEAFDKAARNLDVYGLSEVVETEFGWFVILRMPTTPDDIVEYADENNFHDLRYLAAAAAYDSQVDEWVKTAEYKWAEGFEDFNLGELLAG